MLTGRVHRFYEGYFSVVLEEKDIGLPNGLLWVDEALLIASWGRGMREDFSTEEHGKLYRYEPLSRRLVPLLDKPTGNLDGLAVDSAGRIFMSDWISGQVLMYDGGDTAQIVAVTGKGNADLTYYPPDGLIVIPLMLDNAVVAFKLERAS